MKCKWPFHLINEIHFLNEKDRPQRLEAIFIFFRLRTCFFKISHQDLRYQRALILPQMVRESRRVSDESWQESLDDGRAHGYGAGTSTSVAKAGFNRDSREGDVSG